MCSSDLEMFNAALQEKPDNLSAQEGIALITLNEGKQDLARKLLLEVIEKSGDTKRWRSLNALGVIADLKGNRSEERRVGKECRSRGGRGQGKERWG